MHKNKGRVHMKSSILEIFDQIPDPRIGNAIRYNLSEVLVIAVLAVLCGMEHFTEMEMFAQEQEEWLKKFLELENGVPSHDTFGDIFAIIEPELITTVFRQSLYCLKCLNSKAVL
jgi:hypothetical protein